MKTYTESDVKALAKAAYQLLLLRSALGKPIKFSEAIANVLDMCKDKK